MSCTILIDLSKILRLKLTILHIFNQTNNHSDMLPTIVITPKIISALVCIAGIEFDEYYSHNHMKPYISKTTKSYHVTISDVAVWSAAFYGSYCTSYRAAKVEFNKCVKASPATNYQIISYPAVVKGFLFPSIIAVTGESKLLEENKH